MGVAHRGAAHEASNLAACGGHHGHANAGQTPRKGLSANGKTAAAAIRVLPAQVRQRRSALAEATVEERIATRRLSSTTRSPAN